MPVMVCIPIQMKLCLCRHTAMQQELEKLRVKLRTADFVRTNSGSGLEQRCGSVALLYRSRANAHSVSVQAAHSCACHS